MEHQIAQKRTKNTNYNNPKPLEQKEQIEQEERVEQEDKNKQHNEHTYNTLYKQDKQGNLSQMKQI